MKHTGVRIPALIASFALTAVAAAAVVAEGIPMEDDSAPGLFILLLFVLAVLFVLVVVGIILGIISIAATAVFVGLGILSSSALVGIFKRRFSAGFRALHYQISALIALPFGIGVVWLGSALFEFQLRERDLLIYGALAGILAGIGLAVVLDRLVQLAYRRLAPQAAPSKALPQPARR